MGKRLAMHQPNYLPWIGYFHKMANCDVFVYLDSVQYPRGQSFAARNRIRSPNGELFLTIPVSLPKGRGGKVAYTEVAFADDRWRERHLKTIEGSYRRAPFFADVFEMYRDGLYAGETLVDVNIALIERFADYLGIRTQRIRLSDVLQSYGEKTRLILDLCAAIGAEAYLSGTGGGREYNDERLMNESGTTLEYDTFRHPVYPQLWKRDFEANLSIIDYLFNCGPEAKL
jgi:hypothetical protein